VAGAGELKNQNLKIKNFSHVSRLQIKNQNLKIKIHLIHSSAAGPLSFSFSRSHFCFLSFKGISKNLRYEAMF
jgi:hypothetical protein